MYLLIKVNNIAVLKKVRGYLKQFGLWLKEFDDPEYMVDVSAEERAQVLYKSGCHSDLNPNKAWETCNSFIQAWDWDSLGRGPYPADESVIKRNGDHAPERKGWIIEDGKEIRVAGECANPKILNYISCTKWCVKYEPMSIPAVIFVAEQVAKEHERRAQMLRRRVEYLKATDLQYREAIATGGVFDYKDGKFVIRQP